MNEGYCLCLSVNDMTSISGVHIGFTQLLGAAHERHQP